MIRYARLDENNIVEQAVDLDESLPEEERAEILAQIAPGITWMVVGDKVSTNGNLVSNGTQWLENTDQFVDPQPSPNHILDENNVWVDRVPVDVSHRGLPHQHPPQWDDERQKWHIPNVMSVAQKGADNTRGIFVLSRATELKAGETIRKIYPMMSSDPPICFFGYGPYNSDGTAKEDMWEICPPDYKPGVTPELFQDLNIFKDFGADITDSLTDGNRGWHAISKLLYMFDGSPYFYIVHIELMNLAAGHPQFDNVWEHSTGFEEFIRKLPPARVAHSLAELFRLITEWDWAYHYLDSRDDMAVLSHNTLAVLGMPSDIYDALIAGVDEGPLARWLNGDTDAYSLPDERSPIPSIVQDWINERIWDFRHRIEPAPFNGVPFDENHYRI